MLSRAEHSTMSPAGENDFMPFQRRKKLPPLDEGALYQYAVGALARQMRTVDELKRLMSRRVEEGDAGESKMAAVVARLAERRYLDDRVFAYTYARLRRRIKASASAEFDRSLRERASMPSWLPMPSRLPTERSVKRNSHGATSRASA